MDSLAYLESSKQVRDPSSKDKVEDILRNNTRITCGLGLVSLWDKRIIVNRGRVNLTQATAIEDEGSLTEKMPT